MRHTNNHLLVNFFHFEWTKLNKKFRIGFLIPFFFLLGCFTFLFVFYSTEVDSTDMAGSYFSQGDDLDPAYILGQADGEFDERDEMNLAAYTQILHGNDYPDSMTWPFFPVNSMGRITNTGVFEQNVLHFEHMLEHQIEPRYPLIVQASDWEFYQTDIFFPEEEFDELNYQWGLQLHYWTPHRSQYDKGMHTVWYSIRENFYFIPFFIIVVILSASAVSDKSFSKNHLSFLKLHSIRPIPYYFAKWLSHVFWIISLYASLLAGMLLTSLLYNGIGDYAYPLFHYAFVSPTLSPELTMMFLGDYVIQALVLMVMGTICVVTLMQWIGQFVRSELFNGLLGAGILLLPFILPTHNFNPLVFFRIHDVISGNVQFEWSYEYLQFNYGVYWFLGLTSLFFIGGLLNMYLNWNYRKAYLVA